MGSKWLLVCGMDSSVPGHCNVRIRRERDTKLQEEAFCFDDSLAWLSVFYWFCVPSTTDLVYTLLFVGAVFLEWRNYQQFLWGPVPQFKRVLSTGFSKIRLMLTCSTITPPTARNGKRFSGQLISLRCRICKIGFSFQYQDHHKHSHFSITIIITGRDVSLLAHLLTQLFFLAVG